MTRELGIRIEGIEVFAFHGVLPEEKAQGQEFVFDVELVPNSDRACDTDKLDDAVDYGAITEAVVAIATAEPVDLIGEGRLLKLGKTLAVGDFTIWSDGMAEPVAHATVTYAIPPKR